MMTPAAAAGAGPGSPERVLEALSGGVPDRLPFIPKIWVDLAAVLTGTDLIRVVEDPDTALSVIADAGLALGLDAVRQFPFPPRRTLVWGGDVFEAAQDGRVLGSVDIAGGLATLLESADDFKLDDPRFVAYYNFRHSPVPLIRTPADAKQISLPGRDVFDELGWADRQTKVSARVNGRLLLIADCGSVGISFASSWNGMETTLFDLFDNPETVHALLAKGTALAIEKGKYWIDQGFRVLRLNDSAGNMSVISPAQWNEFVFPHFRDVVQELHSYKPSCKIYCHICGNVLPVIEKLVETGLDCIGPLDPLGGVTTAEVRRRIGQSAALMGGIDTLSFVNSLPDRIVAEAAACAAGAGRKGFILGSGCVVPRTAKRENISAVAEWVRRA